MKTNNNNRMQKNKKQAKTHVEIGHAHVEIAGVPKHSQRPSGQVHLKEYFVCILTKKRKFGSS